MARVKQRRTDRTELTVGVGRASISQLQLQLLRLIAGGHGNKDIAQRIGRSENDVKVMVSRLLATLHVANRAELAQVAVRLDVIGESELSEHEIHQLLRQSPVLTAITRGPEHRFVFVNDAFRRAVGDLDYIGQSAASLFPHRPDLAARLDETYRTGRVWTFKGTNLVPAPAGQDARRAEISFVEQPVRDDEGSITGIAFFGLDLTDAVAGNEGQARSAESAG